MRKGCSERGVESPAGSREGATWHMALHDGRLGTGGKSASGWPSPHDGCWSGLRALGGDTGSSFMKLCSFLPPAASDPVCLPRKQAWRQTPRLTKQQPCLGAGWGPEDAPWLLRRLPAQGAAGRAWCAVCGPCSCCPQFWLWKVRPRRDWRGPAC